MTHQDPSAQHLPACVVEYINHVIRRMRYSRSARREVKQELLDHFTDALADCPDPQQRQKLAEQMIGEFGDAKLLATLLRRAKKRNRPAWLKALIRTGQAFLLLILGLCLYVVWIALGTPHLAVNYLALLNDARKPAIQAKDNAWAHYERVIELCKEPPSAVDDGGESKAWPDHSRQLLTALSDTERTALRKWIDENEPAWQEYLLASQTPYCWMPYAVKQGRGPGQPPLIDLELPKLKALRSLARIGVWRARFEAAQGHYEQAFQTCLALLRVARHWQRPGDIVIPQLVGVGIAWNACDEIAHLLASAEIPPAMLTDWQRGLAAIYPDGYPLLNPEGERYFLLDCVQYTFTDSGPGGGHIIPRQAMRLLHDINQMERTDASRASQEDGFVLQFMAAVISTTQAGRDETLRRGNAIYDMFVEQARMTPYERRRAPDIRQLVQGMPAYRFALLTIIIPALDRASDLSFQSRTEYEAAMTILALKRYRAERGRYPATLDDLVAQHYLDHVPMDPYSADPLHYAQSGDGFTLYSVGGNFQDDRGVPNPTEPWARGSNYDAPVLSGDRVFWPLQPLRHPQVPQSQSS